MANKCILSLGLARYLLSLGFVMIDIETSRKLQGKVAFIFRDGQELNEAIQKYSKGA